MDYQTKSFNWLAFPDTECREGRKFESSRPDQLKTGILAGFFYFREVANLFVK